MSTSTERMRIFREREKLAGRNPNPHQRDHDKKRREKSARELPFVGCDGEGGGLDEQGRQIFKLFRMGARELYNNNARLSTHELLDFICDAPKDAILVGFAFGYDATMILLDLPSERRERLLVSKSAEERRGKSPFTYWEDFGIEYMPKQYLKVCRINRDGEKCNIISGSTRVIYETFGFFQKSFLKTLHTFKLGLDYLDLIERSKSDRKNFGDMNDEIRNYNRIECELLAELMETLRSNCETANIIPRQWNGAGKLAEALHRQHGTMDREKIETRFGDEVLQVCEQAYYGGRFEISRTGKIPGPVYEYDIRSAYPKAMEDLPCLCHGKFEKLTKFGIKNLKPDDLYCASVSFKYELTQSDIENPDNRFGRMGGLPIRNKQGRIFWPMQGAGVYWSCEIESAKKLGFKISYRNVWRYKKECDCKPFAWVRELYNYRRLIGSTGPGYPIKLAINSLYGKLAQRLGRALYHNMIWAGLITAQTRARLNEGIVLNPGRIAMIATDGIYSLDPLPLELGEDLGQWEENVLHDGMFVVQPGLYWGAKKLKTRGVSPKFFEECGRVEQFHDVFECWKEYDNSVNRIFVPPPSVKIPVTSFIGLKIAQARGKPELAGTWITPETHADACLREISFAWSNKRYGHIWKDGYVLTAPIEGDAKLVSLPHREMVLSGRSGELDAIRAELDDMPDYDDMSPPWKD